MKPSLFVFFVLLFSLTLSAYEVIVFGDMHFDSPEVRDPALLLKQYQKRKMQRNLKALKQLPELLQRAFAKITPETAFVMQLGDVVQGDCGSRSLHEKSLKTILTVFEQRFSPKPFLLTQGNHDIRGPGAPEAYEAVIFPYLSRLTGQQILPGSPLQYVWMQEKDLFVFWDSNHPDLEFLEETLALHPEHRRLFLVTHLPVIPIAESRPEWIVFRRKNQAEQRKKLISLLAKNHAVVLCAHIHRTTLVRWENEEGSIVQATCFSMFPEHPQAIRTIERDLKAPFSSLTKNKEKRKKMTVVEEFLPGYREIKEFQPHAGFAVLKAEEKEILLEYYHTENSIPTATLKLR